MIGYSLYHRLNTKQEIAHHTPGIPTIKHFIEEEKWKDYINSHPDFFFEYDTPMGKLGREDKEDPLNPQYYFARAFYGNNPGKGYSDTEIVYFGYKITFQFPVTTPKRLDMMWEMAHALDCHFVKGNSTIIDEQKFQKLKAKYDRSKK